MKEGTHLAEGTGTDGRTSSLGHVHSQWSASAPWECRVQKCSHNDYKGLGAEAKP